MFLLAKERHCRQVQGLACQIFFYELFSQEIVGKLPLQSPRVSPTVSNSQQLHPKLYPGVARI